ncbi:MAG: Rpn family recombination-promoting nuclease/putative transposase [Desulfobacterales bacterium]|nr:Rpn family recombination-promoting nuclease/putative transposase [Desulfobacterales bacterium]
MELIFKPYDKYFKELLEKTDHARSFFENYLSSSILQLLDLNTLRIEKESFIEEDLKEYFSDLLYSVKFGDKTGYVYLLLEHKSDLYKYVSLQMLHYKTKIWRRHVNNNKGSDLPIVISLLIYHGRQPWSYGNKFSDIVEKGKDDLKPYIPDFEYILCDLSTYQDHEIKGILTLKVGLFAIKYIFDPNLWEHLPKIFALLKEVIDSDTGIKSLEALLRYIFSAREDILPEKLKELVENNLSKHKGGIVMTVAERLMQQGALQDAKESVIEVLEAKFNSVNRSIAEKIEQIGNIAILKSLRKKAVNIESLAQFEMLMNQALQ